MVNVLPESVRLVGVAKPDTGRKDKYGPFVYKFTTPPCPLHGLSSFHSLLRPHQTLNKG